MSFIVNVDPLKVKIKKSFLYNDKNKVGFEDAYLIAVKSIPNRCLFFTVHLESGAVFSHVPITEILCDKYGPLDPEAYPLEVLQPYSCLQGEIQVIKYNHLKDCTVKVKERGFGYYLFTVDYLGEGLSEDPDQYKSHNIIILNNGLLCAVPNNFCLFVDGFFTKVLEFPSYVRQTKYHHGPA